MCDVLLPSVKLAILAKSVDFPASQAARALAAVASGYRRRWVWSENPRPRHEKRSRFLVQHLRRSSTVLEYRPAQPVVFVATNYKVPSSLHRTIGAKYLVRKYRLLK